MVGWLKIPNMKYIDFPIVQGKDNDKYLKLDYYGRTTSYGNPFLDFRNNIKELDRNTIIFGHHMRSGDQVFSELTDYLTIDGFKRNPVIEYNTLYADYQWKVYAVFLTNSKAEHDNGIFLTISLPICRVMINSRSISPRLIRGSFILRALISGRMIKF